MNNNENPRKINSVGFGWELVKSLVVPYVNQRSVNGLSRSIQNKIYIVVGKRVDRVKAKIYQIKSLQKFLSENVVDFA